MQKRISKSQVQLIVYDFDGVMTDNRVLFQEDGIESVWVCRADSLGINMIRAMGIPQLILSTEANRIVQARARKVKLPVVQGVPDKRESLQSYCHDYGYDWHAVLYVGNDMNDFDVMKSVRFPVAPADAHPVILKIAAVVLKTRGGYGVVRELADRLI